MKRFVTTLFSLSLIVGCGPGDEAAGDGPNAIVHEGECNQEDFSVESGTAIFGRRQGKEFLGYSASGAGSRYDKIEFSSVLLPEDEGVPLPAGTYTLSAEHGNAAEPLVRAYRDCEDDDCNEIYQATGKLVIEASGAVGGVFKARLDNVTFEEMEDDGSEPKRRGGSFCGSAIRWEAPVESNIAGDCSTEGEGNMRGDRLKDLVLTNCYGDTVAVHDNCGHVKAQVIVLTASWCSACRTRLPATEALVQQYKDQGEGVEAYYVLGQGPTQQPATQQDCFGDAQGKGIDPARMLLDNGNGRSSFHKTWREQWITTCDNGLPSYYVLDGDNMNFNFASRCHSTQTDSPWDAARWGPEDPRAASGARGYELAIEELLDD